MNLEEIVASLKRQAQEKDALAEEDSNSPDAKDAEALMEAMNRLVSITHISKFAMGELRKTALDIVKHWSNIDNLTRECTCMGMFMGAAKTERIIELSMQELRKMSLDSMKHWVNMFSLLRKYPYKDEAKNGSSSESKKKPITNSACKTCCNCYYSYHDAEFSDWECQNPESPYKEMRLSGGHTCSKWRTDRIEEEDNEDSETGKSKSKYKYRVEWNDHEGNLHEYTFDNIADAKSEADSLRKTYVGVCIKLVE